jgi:hypothetical protein
MDYIYWRNLIGVTHTEAEAKAMAAEFEYKDGPDDQGEYFMRAGKVCSLNNFFMIIIQIFLWQSSNP